MVEHKPQCVSIFFNIGCPLKENTVYSEDIEYKSQRIFETNLVPGEPVKIVDVDITGAKTLLLCTRSFPYKDKKGAVAFSIPHVAICDPVLSK